MLALHHGLHLNCHLTRRRPEDVGNVLSVLFFKLEKSAEEDLLLLPISEIGTLSTLSACLAVIAG